METIFDAAHRLSRRLGAEVDVEFAVPRTGEPVILQGRPLTRAGPARTVEAAAARGPAVPGRPCAPGAAAGRLVTPGDGIGRPGPRVALVETLTPADYGLVFRHAAIVMMAETSPLGHVAILCRELGVPLICGVGAAARSLIGHWVVVDGQAGSVQPVAPARVGSGAAKARAAGPLVMTDLELALRVLAEARPSGAPASEAGRLLRQAARTLGASGAKLIPAAMDEESRASPIGPIIAALDLA